jgi:hypothetical protein
MKWATKHELDGVCAVELSQVTAPLSDSDRCRLAEFWAAVIAESGAEWPMAEVRAGESRRARRAQRQRADRLVRVLSTASQSAFPGLGVAA